MSERMTGGCACGKVRFSALVEDDAAYLCHCRMCQKATGSLSIAFKNLPQAAVEWEGEPDWFESSPIAERPFCSKCGTSMGFRYKDNSANMDLTVASFDDPGHFRPTAHFGAESMHRAWLDTSGLKETKCSDYDKLVQRWTDATGRLPA